MNVKDYYRIHPDASLKEYIEAEKLDIKITGFEMYDEMYAIAFIVATDDNMIMLRDALKPHRGELYEG